MLSAVTPTIQRSARAIACILADWGTTNLRAWAVGTDGAILDRRDRPRGLLAVEAYYDLIRPRVASLDIWQTTYLHVLTGDDAWARKARSRLLVWAF